MKRICSLFLLCCMAVLAMAAKGNPEIEFETLSHDFGTIREADGKVTCTFRYSNTGSAPLALTSVSAPCSCTKTAFSPRPLAPGKSAEITVTFTPADMAGEFMRSISVWTNVRTDSGRKKKVTLKISGTVIPDR